MDELEKVIEDAVDVSDPKDIIVIKVAQAVREYLEKEEHTKKWEWIGEKCKRCEKPLLTAHICKEPK